jgi:hypothetical protein
LLFTSTPLKKSLAVRGEDGVVTIVERQLDFEGAIDNLFQCRP